MDVSGSKTSEMEKRYEESLSYQHSSILNDWQCSSANSSILSMRQVANVNATAVSGDTVGSSGSSSSMVESFGPSTWEPPVSAALTLSFNEMNVYSGVSTFDPLTMLKGGLFSPNMSGMPHPSLSHLPADSGFIERAACFSSFGKGHFGDLLNPSGVHPYLRGGTMTQDPPEFLPRNAIKQVPCRLPPDGAALEGSPSKNEMTVEIFCDQEKQAVPISANNSEEAEIGGRGALEDRGCSPGKGFGSKKRKRINHDAVLGQDNGVNQQFRDSMKNNTATQQEGVQNPTPTDSNLNGKHGKEVSQGSDPSKGDYIHIRARRGQATNSHSLAERVRREKISERMKYLQELVPGCSKVTGKAVMLDEIINYVESLQRQVEFLSMKLATVNPRLDLNIGQLLAKNQMFAAQGGSSSGRGFSSDMPIGYPPFRPTQPLILPPEHPGIKNSSDALKRMFIPQLANNGGYKEPTPKMPNVWEDELHTVVQMGLNASAPLENQQASHIA